MKNYILLIACFLQIFILYSCRNKEVVKIFLIPKGYEGSIVMIEDQQQKDSVQIKGDTLTFDFRKSKILRLKGKFIEGVTAISNIQYYYVDSSDNRTIIPIFLNGMTNIDSSLAYIYMQKTMIGGECPKIGLRASQCDLITKPENIDYNSAQQEELFDSLISCPVDIMK
jgi:hypothetical protein